VGWEMMKILHEVCDARTFTVKTIGPPNITRQPTSLRFHRTKKRQATAELELVARTGLGSGSGPWNAVRLLGPTPDALMPSTPTR
jgi:hypothetical protein